MTQEEFLDQLKEFNTKFKGEVISHFAHSDNDRGHLAFRQWKSQLLSFLRKYVPHEAKSFEEVIRISGLTSAFAGSPYRGSASDRFMYVYGKKTVAFLEHLSDSVKKGYIIIPKQEIVEIITKPTTSENPLIIENKKNFEINDEADTSSTDEDSKTYIWLKKNKHVITIITLVIFFILSLLWFIKERNYEPALGALSTFTGLVGFIFNKGVKGYFFLLGLFIGSLLTLGLFYIMPFIK